MDGRSLRVAAAAFFDEFVKAFRTFDGSEIARRYVSPYVAVHADGSIDCFSAHLDVVEYFQRVVGGYHRKGCRSCRYHDLDVVSVGRQCALATVTWELLREDGSVVSSWRESYNLARVGEDPRVFASIVHAV